MLKLSSIEICATSNVNRAWQIASQRLPFENGIRKRLVPGPTCFSQRAIIKIRPIFFQRDSMKSQIDALFTLFSTSFQLRYRNSSRLPLYMYFTLVLSLDITLFREGTIQNRDRESRFRNVEFVLSLFLFHSDLQRGDSMADKIFRKKEALPFNLSFS